MKAALRTISWTMLLLLCVSIHACAQATAGETAASAKAAAPTTSELEQKFFAIVRSGDALGFLSYVPEDGVNLGRDAQNSTRASIEDQLTHRTGLYCKLFESSCIPPPARPDPGVQLCSYRELLTQSEKVRTASTGLTRNGVRQAILVAQVQNEKCGGAVLIDFIFNYHHAGWKLFSIP